MIIGPHKITVYLNEADADIMQNALMAWKGPYRDGETLTQEEKNRVIELTERAKSMGHGLQLELIRKWDKP